MIMAITGLALTLFVVVHMIGNLQIFAGPSFLNEYARILQSFIEFLWVARLLLLAALVLHITFAVWLTVENFRARPQKYVYEDTVQASYASRMMLLGGAIVFFFVAYHLLHFTFGTTNPDAFHHTDAHGRHDVYAMVVLSFRNPLIAVTYILAMIPLALHLSHGIQSAFQTLGMNHPKYTPIIQQIGKVAGLIIFIGNISIPIAALTHFLKWGTP